MTKSAAYLEMALAYYTPRGERTEKQTAITLWFCHRTTANDLLRADWCYMMYLISKEEEK